MEYRNLGKSGLQVSVLGLGTNNFGMRSDRDTSIAVVNRALDSGITFIDTSDSYGGQGRSEEYIGEALKGRRQEAVLATKFSSPMGEGPYMSGGSRRYVMRAVEASLRRLQTDYIDLYQFHWPDPRTPIEETLRALDDLVRRGDVRYIGCSNFAAWQVVEAAWTARTEHLTPFISAQNLYNLTDRGVERELLPACRACGLGFIPYFPLASGLLTGKYRRGEPPPEGARLSAGPMASRFLSDRNFDLVERLESVASASGHTVGELAVAWLAAQPAIGSVIVGVRSPEQLDAHLQAVEWKMTPEELQAIDEASRG
ncbi:MAG TPA: aldo/keto reductase [Dehalococcoidia bacterium]|nr:aldo/keto reductase [Dehalococcoidia bacterium]